jgi:hypothetical protein
MPWYPACRENRQAGHFHPIWSFKKLQFFEAFLPAEKIAKQFSPIKGLKTQPGF